MKYLVYDFNVKDIKNEEVTPSIWKLCNKMQLKAAENQKRLPISKHFGTNNIKLYKENNGCPPIPALNIFYS